MLDQPTTFKEIVIIYFNCDKLHHHCAYMFIVHIPTITAVKKIRLFDVVRAQPNSLTKLNNGGVLGANCDVPPSKRSSRVMHD